jgi:hypothetical protein
MQFLEQGIQVTLVVDPPKPVQDALEPSRRKLPPGQASEFLHDLCVGHGPVVMADRIGKFRGFLFACL